MRDQNQTVQAGLPPANFGTPAGGPLDAGLKQRCTASFMEDWPAPPKCDDEEQMDDLMKIELRKWRLQTLLAVQPFGVPSLALAQTYERMFGAPFDLRTFGCDNLIPELANKMADIMIVQEPDETTPILFPEYPNDKIFHDARLGYDFSKPNMDGDESKSFAPLPPPRQSDANDLILRAWLDRDLDFPEDVVLVGEPFEELCKVALAMVPGSRGLYRATIVSSGSPDSVFIRLKTSDQIIERIRGLSMEIVAYFRKTQNPIDSYNVPEHFITLNFPCLLYSVTERTWTRCVIVGRSRRDHKVYVESIDFGGIYAVNKIFLYLMPREFLSIPRLTFEVSLAGLKPANGTSWSKTASTRLRCFSMPDYYLDILLLDPKRPAGAQLNEVTVEDLSPDNSLGSTGPIERSIVNSPDIKELDDKKRKRFANRAAYQAIIIDRNDDETDIFLNEILTIETYAIEDPGQSEELSRIKSSLIKVLETVPRPTNPLGPIIEC